MDILETKEVRTYAIKFSVDEDGKEVGRARLYVIYNDLHEEPYGLLEDVFVDNEFRSNGYGSELVKAVIEKAKQLGCRKLIGQSRYGKEKVHDLYSGLGFKDHGKNFRMDLV